MATMHGIGEAAGIAAAEAVRRDVDAITVPGEWIRAQIPYLHEPADLGVPWDGPGDIAPQAGSIELKADEMGR